MGNYVRDVNGGTVVQAHKIDTLVVGGEESPKIDLFGGHLSRHGDWKGVPFGRATKGWQIVQGELNPALVIKVANPTSCSIFVEQVSIDIAQDGDLYCYTPHFLSDFEHPWFPRPVKREIPSRRGDSWLVNLKLFGDMVRLLMGDPEWPIFHVRARAVTEDDGSVLEDSWNRFPPK